MSGRKKKVNTKPLKKKLDTLFSRYIRSNGAFEEDGELVNHCYTCGRTFPVKKLQAGHFVPRQYLATRYDERNVKPQCYADNFLYNCQPSAFASHLIKDYGNNIILTLESLRKEKTEITPQWFEEKIETYKTLLRTY